jgi:hypothetical protein
VARQTEGPATTTCAYAHRGNRCGAAANAGQHEQHEHEAREDGDVAAGDRDDVVDAGCLQPHPDVVRQSRAIADEHGRDDSAGNRVVGRHPARHATSHVRASGRRGVLDLRRVRVEANEKPALDRADQSDAVERCVPLEVRHAGVQKPRRPSERHRRVQRAAGRPLGQALPRLDAANGEADALVGHDAPRPRHQDRASRRAQEHRVVSKGGVFGQAEAGRDRLVTPFGTGRA